MEIAGRVALVTGGASGIGNAAVVALARQGASIVFIDRGRHGAGQTISRVLHRDRVVFRACDVTDGKELAAAVDPAQWIGSAGSTSSLTSLASVMVICSPMTTGPGGASLTSI